MASSCSFDVVSEINLQEVDNAVNQANKELSQRYDFKGSKFSLELDKEEIKVTADSEFKLEAIIEVLKQKCVKRNVPIRSLDIGKVEQATGATVRQIIKIQRGISKEKGKDIVAEIKASKLKVQAQIMDDQVRVVGKNKDDLQEVIQMLKQKDFGVELQFTNYRS